MSSLPTPLFQCLQQVREFEQDFPGPYTLEGFQPYPPERYGLTKEQYFKFTPNAYDPRSPHRNRTKEHRGIADVWDEVVGQFQAAGQPIIRMKVYVIDSEGRRVYIDSQVMEKARRLIIPAGG